MWNRSEGAIRILVEEGWVEEGKNEGVLEVTGTRRELVQQDIESCDKVEYMAFQIACVLFII